MKKPQSVLQQPIKQLSANENFVKKCGEMGFENLSDILTCDQVKLQKKAEFSYLWLEELLSILDQNDMMELWQPATGKNSF